MSLKVTKVWDLSWHFTRKGSFSLDCCLAFQASLSVILAHRHACNVRCGCVLGFSDLSLFSHLCVSFLVSFAFYSTEWFSFIPKWISKCSSGEGRRILLPFVSPFLLSCVRIILHSLWCHRTCTGFQMAVTGYGRRSAFLLSPWSGIAPHNIFDLKKIVCEETCATDTESFTVGGQGSSWTDSGSVVAYLTANDLKAFNVELNCLQQCEKHVLCRKAVVVHVKCDLVYDSII